MVGTSKPGSWNGHWTGNENCPVIAISTMECLADTRVWGTIQQRGFSNFGLYQLYDYMGQHMILRPKKFTETHPIKSSKSVFFIEHMISVLLIISFF